MYVFTLVKTFPEKRLNDDTLKRNGVRSDVIWRKTEEQVKKKLSVWEQHYEEKKI